MNETFSQAVLKTIEEISQDNTFKSFKIITDSNFDKILK